MNTTDALSRILRGDTLSADEIYSLVEFSSTDQLLDLAAEITHKFIPPQFDSCSIINARSGRCPEDCRWCAQSAHYHTGCDTYDIAGHEQCLQVARYNSSKGVKRLSLVASGRWMKGKALDELCNIFRDIHSQTDIYLCASLGLLDRNDLTKLRDAGVRRYHCNLETAPSHFPSLCSTHTIDDKINTIRTARDLGFEICSGGIIGMGESEHQRVEFALKLREIAPHSIPINILCPIPGTPLQHTPPLSEDEILRTVAIFRIVHPRTSLRFAGGRSHLSRQAQIRALKAGINGAIVGDLLTTLGSTIAEDKALANDSGLNW